MKYSLRRVSAAVLLTMVGATCFGSTLADTSTVADSVPPPGRWYLGLDGGLLFPDRARDRENAGAVGLRFGTVLNPHWNLEINLLDSRHSGNYGNPQLTLRQASLDALRVFNRNGRFAPYLKAGLGLVEDVPRGLDSRTSLMEEAGLGVIVHLWSSADARYSLDLRPEADLRWDGCHDCGQTMMDGLIGLGFDLAFGGERPASEPEASPAPPAAPPHPPIAAQPAPQPPPPPPPAPPPPARPRTASPKPVVLTQVHFAVNSAELQSGSHVFLDRLAAGLKANPKIHVVLEGYTDSRGSAAYNLELSQRRADAVRAYLIDRGVARTQLSAKGFGKADSISTNQTPAGRQANRRTVMRVTSNPDAVPVEQVLCGTSC